MTQTSQPWDGRVQGDGTRAPYNASKWDDHFEDMFNSDVNRGVLANRSNELAGSVPGANQFRVASGAALVKGKWYRNDANVNFAPASASGGNVRCDRIVLSSTWANINDINRDPAVQLAQTIRLIRLINPVENVPAPAITQNDGVLWEIPLYRIRIDSAGTVVICGLTLPEPGDDREGIPGTKQFFIPCVGGDNITDAVPLVLGGPGWTLLDNKKCAGYGWGLIPDDFIAGLTVTAVVIPMGATANIYSWNLVYAGACAENANTHSATSGYQPVTVTNLFNNCIQQLSLRTASKGDILSLQYTRDAISASDTLDVNAYFVGWIVEYK